MFDYKLMPGEQFAGGFRRGAERLGMLRNSTGSNTHVPPHDLVHYEKSFFEGVTDTWAEYVPTTYDGSHPVPLVVVNHAGGSNAEVQFDETSWAIIAEQEGLICVYPNAIVPGVWLGNPEARTDESGRPRNPIMDLAESPTGTVPPETHDIAFVCALIEEMKQKYNIDAGRIYMQGMSMGDIMTMQFSRIHGDLLAGAANAAGPSPEQVLFTEDGQLKGFKAPVPVYQSRGELDSGAINGGYSGTLDRWHINAVNRKFWCEVNGCKNPPELAIRDFNNYAFFHGEKADLYYRDVKYRAHGQMLDDAETAWYQLFSGTRRMPDGSIQRTDALEQDCADHGAAALSAGCSNVLLDNKLVDLGAPVESLWLDHVTFDRETRTPHAEPVRELLYVPLSFLEKYYGVKVERDGKRAVLTLPDGRVCQVAGGSIGCMVDNRFCSMSRQTEWLHDQLYVPVQWFAANLFGQYSTGCDGSLYLSDHFGDMTHDMALLIKLALA